jgi:hypothetical protein
VYVSKTKTDREKPHGNYMTAIVGGGGWSGVRVDDDARAVTKLQTDESFVF